MAGIGFRIQRILHKNSISSVLQAYGYAALVSSGPWILSIISLAILGLIIAGVIGKEASESLFVTITHVFAFSLILTGPVQLVLSRFSSDKLFVEDNEAVYSSFVSATFLMMAISGLLGIFIFGYLGVGSWVQRFGAILFFSVIGGIWMCATYMSILKSFNAIIMGFFVGYLFGFIATVVIGLYGDPEYLMLGFTFGQLVLFLFLFGAISKELGFSYKWDAEFLGYFKKYYILGLCGFFYNTGMWMDKFLHWWLADDHVHIGSIFYASPMYDVAVYLGYLSIAPGMAVFLIKLEADFAIKMDMYVRGLIGKSSFKKLDQLNRDAILAIREGVSLQVKLQTVITGVLLLFAEQVLSLFGASSMQASVFRLILVGSFVMVIFLSIFTCLFYLDRLKEATICCVLFFVLNTVLTTLDIYLGERWYGLGFTLSSFIATHLSFYLLNKHIQNFTYRMFKDAPINV
jgi:uncharacterized membrane protein